MRNEKSEGKKENFFEKGKEERKEKNNQNRTL